MRKRNTGRGKQTPAPTPAPTPASSRLLLVDFENVQQVDLSKLDDTWRVIIFVGGSQKSVPIELVTSAQQLGSRAEWQKITGDGKNALDFVIACHLGRAFERTPRPDCTVLSMDKGFDPLLRYLNAKGMKCRRVNSLLELSPGAARPDDPTIKRVVQLLSKSDKRSRPRKRRTLAQSISAMFQKKLSRQEIDRVIDSMMANRLIGEKHGIIIYEF